MCMYKEVYKGYSPWGGIQHSSVIARGFKYVVTAGHGGIMVTDIFAKKYLSEPCIKRGERYNNYLCYEEDCSYALVELDLLIHYPAFKDKLIKKEVSLEEAKDNLIKSLSYYYPEYLIELGITPDKEQYQLYLDEEKRSQMVKDKHPDLIVSAESIDCYTVQVWTADNAIHVVTTDSYKKLRNNSKLLLLSKCELVQR